MDKQKIIDRIAHENKKVEESRRELLKMYKKGVDTDDFDYQRIKRHFEIDMAFRNGLAVALFLSGDMTDKERIFVCDRYNIPNHLLDLGE